MSEPFSYDVMVLEAQDLQANRYVLMYMYSLQYTCTNKHKKHMFSCVSSI